MEWSSRACSGRGSKPPASKPPDPSREGLQKSPCEWRQPTTRNPETRMKLTSEAVAKLEALRAALKQLDLRINDAFSLATAEEMAEDAAEQFAESDEEPSVFEMMQYWRWDKDICEAVWEDIKDICEAVWEDTIEGTRQFLED